MSKQLESRVAVSGRADLTLGGMAPASLAIALLCAPVAAQSQGQAESPGYAKYRSYVEASRSALAARVSGPVLPLEIPSFSDMAASRHDSKFVLVRLENADFPLDGLESLGVRHERRLGLVEGLHRMWAPQGVPMEELLERLNSHPEVMYAEPDYKTELAEVPNDPGIGGSSAWWLNQVRAYGAWDYATDATAIGPIAVVDTGILETHEDLVDNMWINTAEIPGNGQDDDGNGYVDDVHGIDILFQGPYHGTPVSGTIGARGDNGTGYVGSAWQCQLMDIGAVGSFSATVGAVVEGIDYATSMGSRLSNHSWRVFDYSQVLADSVTASEAFDHLWVCAAGNENNDIDADGHWPASLPNDNVITVAGSTQSENKISYSSYGVVSVDLAAPTEFTTCNQFGGYSGFSGTSQATPVVTGAVALAWARQPQWNFLQVRELLLDNVRFSPLWTGLVSTSGILDMQTMLEAQDCAPVAEFASSLTSGTAPLSVEFSDLTQCGAATWTWDFGDGTTSNEQNPSHTYQFPGNYTVSLQVDGPGGVDIETKSGLISAAAPAPVGVAYGSGTASSEATHPSLRAFSEMQSGDMLYFKGGKVAPGTPTLIVVSLNSQIPPLDLSDGIVLNVALPFAWQSVSTTDATGQTDYVGFELPAGISGVSAGAQLFAADGVGGASWASSMGLFLSFP